MSMVCTVTQSPRGSSTKEKQYAAVIGPRDCSSATPEMSYLNLLSLAALAQTDTHTQPHTTTPPTHTHTHTHFGFSAISVEWRQRRRRRKGSVAWPAAWLWKRNCPAGRLPLLTLTPPNMPHQSPSQCPPGHVVLQVLWSAMLCHALPCSAMLWR